MDLSESAVLMGDNISITNSEGLDNVTASGEDYDYYYDYDPVESFDVFDWNELGPSVAIYSITFVAGVVGNVLILLAVGKYNQFFKSSGSPVNVFLGSLATADLLLIIVCLPLKVAKLFSYTWTMGVFSCKLLYYMQTVSGICSVFNLTALSIERYYAIVHPLRAQYLCTVSKAKKTILCTWGLALVLAAPILLVQVHLEVGSRIKAYWCVRDIDSPGWWQAQEIYLLAIILIIPTVIMGFSYSRIIYEVCRVFREREELLAVSGAALSAHSSIKRHRSCDTGGLGNQKADDSPPSQEEYDGGYLNSCGIKRPGSFKRQQTSTSIMSSRAMPTTLTEVDELTMGAGLGGRESGSPCKDAVMFTSGSNQECLAMNRMNSNKHESNLGSDSQPHPDVVPEGLLQERNDEDYEEEERDPLRSAGSSKRRAQRLKPNPNSGNNLEPSCGPTSFKRLDEETRQIVRMLIFIVVLFVVCWGPLLAFNVLQSFGLLGTQGLLFGTEKHLKTTFSLMAYFNSCLNPIIYGFMSKNFRESFLFSVRRLCRRRRKVVRESSNAKGRNGGQEEKAGACATIAKDPQSYARQEVATAGGVQQGDGVIRGLKDDRAILQKQSSNSPRTY